MLSVLAYGIVGVLAGFLWGRLYARGEISRECRRLGGFYVGRTVFRCVEVRDPPFPPRAPANPHRRPAGDSDAKEERDPMGQHAGDAPRSPSVSLDQGAVSATFDAMAATPAPILEEINELLRKWSRLAGIAMRNAKQEETEFGRRFIEHGAVVQFNCCCDLRRLLDRYAGNTAGDLGLQVVEKDPESP